ncbi:MAG: ABC transporter substrate-binding protein [Pleomorphochaeta sp.]
MKKTIAVLVLLGAMILPLFAQGNSEDEQITLQLMYWDNVQKPVIDSALEKFEAENPNITVETSIVPWGQYWQKLQTTTVAGTAPDVFWMNVPNFPKYTDNNLLLNLTDYISESNVDISKYPKDLIAKYSKDGDNYVIPEQFDTIALAYNKTMFDEANLEYPNEDWTWDDMLTAAKILTKETADGKQYGYLSHYENQAAYYNYMVMNGGDIISEDRKSSGFDNPNSIDAIQFLIDLIYKYEVSPTGQQMVELNSPYDVFTSGNAAMTSIGSWYVPVINDSLGDQVDFAPLPKSPNTNERKTIIHGLGWAGYANTKYPEATWKLINYLISPEFNDSLAQSAITIPAYEGKAQAWVDAVPYYNLSVYIDAQSYSHPYPVSQKTSEWMSIEASEIKDCFLGNTDVTTAMNSIADQMNAILATED